MHEPQGHENLERVSRELVMSLRMRMGLSTPPLLTLLIYGFREKGRRYLYRWILRCATEFV